MRALFSLTGFVALAASAAAQQPEFFRDVYADAVYNRLTGFSTSQIARVGFKKGQDDLHVLFRNETFDTRGTDLPFQYAARGTSVALGYRHWFPGNRMFGTISYGTGLAGTIKDKADFRAGFAGYTDWSNGRNFTDLYGDLFYVGVAKDTYLNLRIRPGRILRQDKDGRLWVYGVGQLFAAGSGARGTENRVEAGLGIGYLFRGKVTLNLEMRGGYAYRGDISKRTYLNPTIILAGQL